MRRTAESGLRWYLPFTMADPVVGALLSKKRMLRKVEPLLRGKASFHAFPSWSELTAFIANGHVDAAFLDPQVDSDANWKDRLLHLEGLGRHQVILYTDLTPEIAAMLLDLARTGVREVVFSRLDDRAQRLHQALVSAGVALPDEPPWYAC